MANEGKETNGTSAETAKQDSQPFQVQVVGQYVKDLSFENPNIAKLLKEPGDNPNIKITVNVSSN
jgi:preprotein translocase subunit SecB